MSGMFPIDPQAALQPDPAHPGESYVNNFVGDDPGLFAGVWSAEAQETKIESYPVDPSGCWTRTSRRRTPAGSGIPAARPPGQPRSTRS